MKKLKTLNQYLEENKMNKLIISCKLTEDGDYISLYKVLNEIASPKKAETTMTSLYLIETKETIDAVREKIRNAINLKTDQVLIYDVKKRVPYFLGIDSKFKKEISRIISFLE